MIRKLSKVILAATLLLAVTALGVPAQVASGGTYTLNQAVIANGGGTSGDAVNNNYKVEGTSGQTAAGTLSSAGTYSIRSGFWAGDPLAPTAAGVSIGGRVVTANGAGIRNVTVILTGGSLITPRIARTGTFGSFSFEDVAVGEIYTISVESKKYGFAQTSQVVVLLDNITEMVFQSDREN